jgi:hypothetical protein
MLKRKNYLLCTVFTIPLNLQKEWVDFMTNIQIPEMISKGYHFPTESGKIIILDNDGENVQIQVTYYFESGKKMLEYYEKEGEFFRKRHTETFKEYKLPDPLIFPDGYSL